jgi:hypothetical protein
VSVDEKPKVTEVNVVEDISGVIDVRLSDTMQTGGLGQLDPKFTTQDVTVPLPVVTTPAVSLPTIEGDVPQEETVVVPTPPVIIC